MELPFDPVMPLLGLYPKNPETPIHIDKFKCKVKNVVGRKHMYKYYKNRLLFV